MSIFEKLKTIFGISDPESEYMTHDKHSAERHTPYINPFKTEKEEKPAELTPPPFVEAPKSQPSVAELDSELSNELVSKIIDIINAGLPDFIKGCIDQKAEAAYIRNNFGASLAEYSSRLQSVIERRAKSEWQAERMELEQQKASTEKTISDAKSKAEELLNKATSLERQKNALNERITLAEQKASALEEENEKLKIENKGLANKLKVAKLNEQEFSSLKEQNNELIEKVKRIEELSAECEKLQSKIKEMEGEKEQQPTARQANIIASLQTEIKAQTDDLYRLKEAKIEADRIVAESKTAYSRLQSESSDKEKQAAARIDELTELSEQKDREIDLLKQDLSQKDDFTEQLKQLIENNQLQQRNNEEKLKQEIVRLREENEQLQKELTQEKKKEKIDLEFAIDTSSVPEYTEEASVEESAQKEPESKPLPPIDKHSKKGRSRKKQVISAIDYSTDYSDWLMPTPPTGAIPIEAEDHDSDTTVQDSKEDSDAPTQMELF